MPFSSITCQAYTIPGSTQNSIGKSLYRAKSNIIHVIRPLHKRLGAKAQGGCFTDSKLPGLPGRSPEEIKSAYPLVTPTWQGLGWYEHYRKIEGAPLEFEKRGEAYKRAQMIVDKLWEVDVASMRQKDMLILVVHADLLDALIKNLMGVSGDDACLVKMRNTAINEFSMDVDSDTGKKHVSVEYLNNFSHLNGLA